MRTATLLSLTLVTLACPATEPTPTDAAKPAADKTPATDQPPTKPADAKPTEPTTPDSKTPGSAIADKRAKAKAKITEVDEAELHNRRTQMLASLNEGRKLIKDGDIPGGIAKYEALLAIAPNYAAALGELGWAEFKANELDDAHAHTLLALSYADDPNKRGMLLYNLGRIAEARGQATQAIDHYQASLTARPNDSVAKQLESVRATAPTLPVPPPAASTLPTGLPIAGKDLADAPAMCKAVGEGNGLCSADDNCQLMAQPDGRTDLGVLELDDGMVHCWQPALQTPSGWLVFGTAMIGQYGSEIDQNVDGMSSRVEKNDAGEFLIIEFTDHVYERIWVDFEDEEVPDGTSTDREAMIICRHDGTPACTEAITTKHSYSGESDEGDDSETYSATVSLRGDKIVVADVVANRIEPSLDEGGWDGYMKLPAGEYAFSELATTPP